MKFGKQLRLLIKPEWADHYVRYKLYKRFLKATSDDDDDGVARLPDLIVLGSGDNCMLPMARLRSD